MGGGKETPRQKMVGLMYLVLMSLLAMNVTKAVLDAFVAIETNLQVGTLAQLDRGNSAIKDMQEALAENQKTNPEKAKKIQYYIDIIGKIDKSAAEKIKFIDLLKVDVLKLMGEQVAVAKDKSEEHIVWIPYSDKDPLRPAKLHLMAVQAKDGYDVPMHTIIGEDLAKVTGEGKKIWEDIINFRKDVCEMVGTYQAPGTDKAFTFKTEAINKFEDNEELEKLVDAMIDKNKGKYNEQDDREVIKDLYIKLSKNEMEKHEELMLHWIARTFDHSPVVAAIASLTALEQEILSARAVALNHIKSRVTTGDYSFNKVMALASGPASANQGEEFEVKVMMAAYDSDNQPTVTVSGGSLKEVKDGMGIVTARASSGPEMTLKGTVGIKKKDGSMKTESWETKVVVMKPQGTVSLPDMNVVYRGYENKIQGVASGYEETILTGQGINLRKSGTGYIGDPGAGRTCTISVAGRNKAANKTVQLGKFEFKVMNLPPPAVYLGSLANGASVSRSALAVMTNIITKYPPEIALNVSFQTVGWELSVSGAPRTFQGKGSALTPEAIALLKQAKAGAKVNLLVTYKKPAGGTALAACILSVQ